jgi:hypothetical protein
MAEELKTEGQEPAAAGSPSGENGASATATDTAPAATSPSAGAAPANNGQPAGTVKESEFEELKADGQVLKLTREQLRELASKGHNYTRKMQEMAEKERAKEREYQSKLNNALQQERERLMREMQERENPPSVEEQNMRRLQQIEAKIEDDKLDRKIQEVTGKFPGVNEKLMLITALERFGKDVTYDDMVSVAQEMATGMQSEREQLLDKVLSDGDNPKVKAFKQKAVDDYLAAKAKESKPKGENGTGGAPGGLPARAKPKNFDEADKEALARLNLLP